ncbi:DUF4401 domain-containing protein [Acinetobacter cumulans]|uniref:DUF4401 domain-containing protein n=1 Tax=Acinetobacter cumulans TaxID=2136182 RepID=A0ABX9U719_9GAMM|nr:DUF2157 domain-containing protein [Acinetobacter cumulans]RLL47362.1 DUF4401 domain-containing protein [Acinetobacter cumulans]
MENLLNRQSFQHHLAAIGFGLLGVSILYLIAANWWMLPQVVQLALPQVLLLIIAVLSVYFSRASEAVIQTLHALCGLMLGLSLAVIGQVYQTGANSYLLFLLWSILLLPWLYMQNAGIFILLGLTGFLALYLALVQLGFHDWQSIVLLQIWWCGMWLLAYWQYHALEKYTLLWIVVLSVVSMVGFFYADHISATVLLISAFVPLSLLAWQSYRKQDTLAVSLLSAGIGINILMWVAYGLIDQLNLGTFGFLILVILSLGIFYLITRFILQVLPKSYVSTIPLGIGAWLAGIFLSAFIFGMVRSAWGALLCGAIAYVVVVFQFRKGEQIGHHFKNQLLYCLLIFSQVGMYGGVLGLTKNPVWAMLVMPPLILVSYVLRLRAWLLWLQLISFYSMLLLCLNFAVYEWQMGQELFSWLWYALHYVVYSLVVVGLFALDQKYQRSLLFWCLAVLLIGPASLMMGRDLFAPSGSLITVEWWAKLIFVSLWWLAFAYIYQHFCSQRFTIFQWALWGIFSIVLLALGYFEIFLCMLMLAWALERKDRLIYACSILVLCLLLTHLYYFLGLSFLVKSLSIFISGLAVLLLAYLVRRNQLPNTQQEQI